MIFALLGFRTFTLPPPEWLPAKADTSSVATSIQVLPGPYFSECLLGVGGRRLKEISI